MRTLSTVVACLVLSACTCGAPVGGTGGGGAEGGGAGGAGGGAAGGGGTGGGAGGAGGGAVACIPGVASIAVTPAGQMVTLATPPAPIAFTATATLTAGGTRDVTGQVSWTASREDDTPPGTFAAAGDYRPQAGAGGTVVIKASDGCVSGQTTVVLKLDVTFKDPGPTVTTRFNGTVVSTGTKRPAIVYPSDQTRFPRNIYKILFQWQRGGNDQFRLTFEGPNSKTVVYSDGLNVQCQATAATTGCMEADQPIWTAIAGSNAGAIVTLTIDGVTASDPNVYRSASIQLGFSKRDVKGAIFYWSTTAAGIRRASVSNLDPEAYLVAKPVATVLPGGAGAVKCVACHTVSRSGKKMFAYTEATVKGEFVYDVTLQSPPTPVITTQIGDRRGFGTFRPDDLRVVATVGDLLEEYDANTGTKIATLPVAKGTNPDWSPTGTELAYSDQAGDSPGLANLRSVAYAAGTWGASRQLVAAGGFTNLFPSFSADGAYVAYARGKGGHGDKTFQLWIAKSDGSVPPVELVTANRIVNNGPPTLGQHENNMPTWAPPGDLQWIAFNSVRPYGVVFPAGGTQQIWVSAIDPARLGQKQADGGMVDPSFPAFRFAFQGLAENNHRAFWTIDVRDPPDGGGPTCSALGSVCGTGLSCCGGLTCTPGGPLGQTCQPPNDGGTCLSAGMDCNQTSGAACCLGLVCDVSTDGGFACNAIIN